MARRRLLTDVPSGELLSQLTDEREIIRHYTLGDEDLAASAAITMMQPRPPHRRHSQSFRPWCIMTRPWAYEESREQAVAEDEAAVGKGRNRPPVAACNHLPVAYHVFA